MEDPSRYQPPSLQGHPQAYHGALVPHQQQPPTVQDGGVNQDNKTQEISDILQQIMTITDQSLDEAQARFVYMCLLFFQKFHCAGFDSTGIVCLLFITFME